MAKWFPIISLVLIVFSISLLMGGWREVFFSIDASRINKMELCWQDNQIPCRWVSNFGNEYGTPVFNYTAPMPYYIGWVFYQLYPSYSFATKIIYLLPICLWAAGFFWLTKGWFDKNIRWVVSLVSAVGVFLILVSVFKQQVGVVWTVGIFPIGWIMVKRILVNSSLLNSVLLSLVLGYMLLVQRENTQVLLVVGLLLLTYGLFNKLSFKLIGGCLLAYLLAIGLASFYVLPSVIERNIVNLKTPEGDLLPISMKNLPDERPVQRLEILAGSAQIFGFEESSREFQFGVESLDRTIIRMAIPYFVDWQIQANGQQINNYYDNNSLGLMTIILGEGRFIVEGKLMDTPVRAIANYISVLTFVVVAALLLFERARIRRWLRYYFNALHS